MTVHVESIEHKPTAECTWLELADAMNRSFEGYVVPVAMSPQDLEARMRSEHIDPFASRLLLADGEVAGVALITRRGFTSRVAAMAITPEWRGEGLGRSSLARLVEEARERRDRRMILEVIESNSAAIRLYASAGFRVTRRLVGYHATLDTAGGESGEREDLLEVDPLEVARLVTRFGEPGLPWMLAPETLIGATRPALGLALGEVAFALVRPLSGGNYSLRSFLVLPQHRRQGWGRRWLRAFAHRDPGATLRIAPLVPEALAADFFTATGWAREDLTQLEMELVFG